MYKVDGTWNSAGSITNTVELIVKFQGHHEKIMAEVTDLEKNSFILGFSWLKHHNPDIINWSKGTVKNDMLPMTKPSLELVPKEYHKFLKIFLKKESEHMLLWKPWDHAIDLKDMFKAKKGQIIPLSPAEQEEVTAFLDDQLKKGYIYPSKSPQTSPVFFIPKKDGKKWMVQDYHYLNKHTVKKLPIAIDHATR